LVVVAGNKVYVKDASPWAMSSNKTGSKNVRNFTKGKRAQYFFGQVIVGILSPSLFNYHQY